MGGRERKKDHAALRTISLFSGKTAMEEAAELLHHEAADAAEAEKTGDPRAMVEREEDAAIRWLGMDIFHEGDDIRIAMHPKGHGVLMIVRVEKGAPYHTCAIKLSRVQVQKLAQLMRDL